MESKNICEPLLGLPERQLNSRSFNNISKILRENIKPSLDLVALHEYMVHPKSNERNWPQVIHMRK